MSDRFSPHYIGTASISLASETYDKLMDVDREAIQQPEPTLEDVTQFGMSPAELRDQGYDLPEDDEDPEEALEFAINHFKQSDAFYEWQDENRPVSSIIWPCDPLEDTTKLVQALHDQYLACCYVEGVVDGEEYKGFMLTGGNMNLSDHLAIAYLEAGFIPPAELLDNAVRNTHKAEWKDRLIVAMEQAASWYSHEAERFVEMVTKHKASEVTP